MTERTVQHVRTYTGDDVDITYDAGRCIHVAECIRRLHAVFDTTRRPWILPAAGSADDIAATIQHCSSGALHYQRKDGGAVESPDVRNTIRRVENGPLYIRGDFTIVNGMGEPVTDDTRASLCRCGGSANKPFCDNTHKVNSFTAPSAITAPEPIIDILLGGKLHIETTTNGPLHITGHFTVLNNKGEIFYQGTDETFCRCGGSARKPFCDGTHEKIGFIAE